MNNAAFHDSLSKQPPPGPLPDPTDVLMTLAEATAAVPHRGRQGSAAAERCFAPGAVHLRQSGTAEDHGRS